MASTERFLAVVFSSLLVTSSYSFPSLRLLFQDAGAGDNMRIGTHLRAETPLGATGRWEWKAAGEASHKSPPLPRGKRGAVIPTGNPLVEAITLLEDETTPLSLVERTTELLEEEESSLPGLAGNGASTEVATMSTSLSNVSTEAAVVPLSTVRYKAQLHGQMTTPGLSEDFSETEGTKDGRRPAHAINTMWPISTATSPAWVASKSSVETVGSTSSSLPPPKASPSPSSRAQTGPPCTQAPQAPSQWVGQCLLAISLLGLVAAFFIITTFVLLGLLLRQRRAYKLCQRTRNHTEMVCISSLLAAEDAEASGGRAPRAKRAKGLVENGSETDMDNLTLNSFLPDH